MSDAPETNKPEFNENQVLANRYEILEEIGSGGLSTVYKALDRVLKRTVAVKLLKSHAAVESEMIRLQIEAKAISHLKHRGIIEVYDFFVADGNIPTLAMEFVDGQPLDDYLMKNGALPQPLALNVLEQICEAIAYAHARNVVHRDLKPGNVLITESDNESFQIKIIDFGLAKLLDSEDGALTRAGSILGTPHYLSPEQGRAQKLDQRSDIYSVGCMFYQMLTGTTPFQGTTAVDVINAHIAKPAPTLREGNRKIEFSEEIEQVVAKALKKDPADRFQNMGEFIQAVRNLIPVPKPLIEVDDAITKRANPLSRVLMVLGALLVPATIIYFIMQYDNSLDIAKEKSDNVYQVRLTNKINTRHVQKWLWHDIEGTVTDDQLKALYKLEDVKRLDLSGSSITDDQLKLLVDLPLLILDLRDTKITNSGIDTILKMKSLQSLLLERCPGVDSTGYRKLAGMKNLRILSLRNSTVSDDDMKYLSKLSNLVLLYISNSKFITNNAVDEVLKLKKLISIRLGGTQVTKTGIERLKPHSTLIFIGMNELNLAGDRMPKEFGDNITMLDVSKNPLDYQDLAPALALPDLWYLNVSGCPNLHSGAWNKLRAQFPIEDAKVVLTDGPGAGAFTAMEVEFYFDPDHYKLGQNPSGALKIRRALIQEQLEGPETGL